jgi:hypothetical protein
MPTARELLEQADALMRRNRARDVAPPKAEEAAPPPAPAVVDDIPELTEVAADSLLGSEAAAAHDLDLARAVPQPSPVPFPQADLLAAVPAAARAGTSADTADSLAAPADELPPLREALARDMPAPPAGSYPPPVVLPPTALDDIPELTEIVEEIEAPSILDATGEFDLGEPSVWMEAGHGEVSILGPWPRPPEADADYGDADLAAMISAASESAPEANEAIGILQVAPELLDAELAAALPIDSAMAPVAIADDGTAAAEAAIEAVAEIPIDAEVHLGEAPAAESAAPARGQGAPIAAFEDAIEDDDALVGKTATDATETDAQVEDVEAGAGLEMVPETAPVGEEQDADRSVAPAAAVVVDADAAADGRVGELEVASEATDARLAEAVAAAGAVVVGAGATADARVRELDAANEATEAPVDTPVEETGTGTREDDAESAAPTTAEAALPAPARSAAIPDWQAGGMVALAGFTGAALRPPAGPAAAAEDGEAERWDRIAEDVRMQVLQRIDLFTDTGLQEQLARRLQPIVDRASGELVTAINQHVGQLMRAYVAEAIEREIEKWRAGGH